MALDENLKALLTQDVNYQKQIGRDKSGQPTWAAETGVKGYVDEGARRIEKADGTVYVSNQTLFFDANDPIINGVALGDRFFGFGIGAGQPMEAVAIETMYSPGPALGAPMQAWLIAVSL